MSVLLGVGASARVGEIVRRLGARRVLLVTDDGVAEHASWIRGVLAGSGVRVDTFVATTPAATVAQAHALAQWASGRGCEAVVALGGDGKLALAQAAAWLLAHGGELEHVARVSGPIAPIVAIPTVAMAVSEVCALRSAPAIVDVRLRPAWTIVDPELHRSCPPELTRACAEQAKRRTIASAARARIDDALAGALARPRDLHARCELAIAALL
ncbi:MAG TPA: iron-containing alcohol dehydrogenase [Nannocystaceae bacterium]|nr:iron-containing alcohol dehydrogenase [Nannocystaceae bacterium]